MKWEDEVQVQSINYSEGINPHIGIDIASGPDSTYIPTQQLQPNKLLNTTIDSKILPIHSFVRLIYPIDGFNLGGIYLIYKQNAKDNTYSFSPKDDLAIPRWAVEPINVYPGLELELKEARRHIEPGIYRVRSIAIDELRCNISITNGVGWSYITDGYLYLPAKDSQGA